LQGSLRRSGHRVSFLGTSSLRCFLFYLLASGNLLFFTTVGKDSGTSSSLVILLFGGMYHIRFLSCRLCIGMTAFHELEVLCGSSYNDEWFILISISKGKVFGPIHFKLFRNTYSFS
jgi:hypothetical protein